MIKLRGIVFIIGVFIVLSFPRVCLSQLRQVPAAIEIASDVSDGSYSVERIVATAKESGFAAVILADRDFMRWEYGFWPLRALLKKTVEDPSISRFGFRSYLQMLTQVRSRFPDMQVISGVESAPHYFWEGQPFSKSFVLRNWHKHLLTIGLEKEEDLRNLPVVGNPAMPRVVKTESIFDELVALGFFLVGIVLLIKARHRYLGTVLRRRCIAGICCVGMGVLFLLNNYPFGEPVYDQYGFDGERPYQTYIDYVNNRGGLTFWMHPEAENSQKIGGVTVETLEYVLSLSQTYNYTGFAFFYEGLKQVGIPGGLWDEMLREYCKGARKSPAWAIGGLGFEKGDLRHALQDLRTMLLVERFDQAAIMDALRLGRMYTLRGKLSSNFVFDTCLVRDTLSNAEAGLGQEIIVQGKPLLILKGHFLDGHTQGCTIQLIRNGSVIQRFSVDVPFDFTWEDSGAPGGTDAKQYYRVEIVADGLHCIANPIFIRRVTSP